MSFAQFAARTLPIKHPVTKKKKEPTTWRVGAKFVRPHGHGRAGEILTVSKIEGERIWAQEDNLWSRMESLELIG